MRTSRRRAFWAAGILFVFATAFQNCGPAFKSAGKPSSSEFGSGVNVASVLKLNPFDGGNPDSDEVSVDFTKRVTRVSVSGLQPDAAYLTDGKFKIDRDTAFPDQIAKPGSALIFPVTDPRFRQANVYFHLSQFTRSLATNGVFPSEFNLLTADAHCEDDDGGNQVYQSNAYYDPSRDLLCMGVADIGAFRAWASNDADVVVHEFGHSVNHQVSSTDILSSTMDLGALDEGLADFWAYSQNGNPYIGRWYGSAIYEASGSRVRPFMGLRNLSGAVNFPAGRTGEKHLDSTVISTVFKGLEDKGVSKNTLQVLGVRVLEDMQIMSTFSETLNAVKAEGAALGIAPATIEQVLNDRKLLRKDDVNQLRLAAAKPVYVIDAHDIPGFQENGNCDGALDAGESAVLYMNLENTGLALGTVQARLTTAVPAAQIEVIPGAQEGTYTHFLANTSYASMMFGNKGDQTYLTALLYAAFAVKVKAGTPAGNYDFNLQLTGMDTVDAAPVTKTIPFTLTVGADPNVAGKCAGNLEGAVYP
jgi:hypothetical protein